jgi:hypothetical protein
MYAERKPEWKKKHLWISFLIFFDRKFCLRMGTEGKRSRMFEIVSPQPEIFFRISRHGKEKMTLQMTRKELTSAITDLVEGNDA